MMTTTTTTAAAGAAANDDDKSNNKPNNEPSLKVAKDIDIDALLAPNKTDKDSDV